jgi:hypothetical protein
MNSSKHIFAEIQEPLTYNEYLNNKRKKSNSYNKQSLYNGLLTKQDQTNIVSSRYLDYTGNTTLTDGVTIGYYTEPLYKYYIFDKEGKLFGTTINKSKHYAKYNIKRYI